MNKAQVNLQDTFLNQVRKENIAVTIYLIGGVQLRGQVRGFDTFTILLDSQGRPTQLVYKSAVTSIVPMRPVNMREAQAEARAAAGLPPHETPSGAAAPGNEAAAANSGAGSGTGAESVEAAVDGASATGAFPR